MKKLVLTVVALLALSLAFVSCAQNDLETLTKDQITADWVEANTWSGTKKSKAGPVKTTEDITNRKYTANFLKANDDSGYTIKANA